MALRPTLLGVMLGVGTLSCASDDVELEAETLAQLVDEGVAAGLPGVILLVDRPGEADDFIAARGLADRAAGTELTTDARFRVASNTKSFVGLTLAQLEVEGIVRLDDPLSTWLSPAVLGPIENAEGVTIRQLLDHTSGIYDYLDDGFEAAVEEDPQHVWTIDEALAHAHGEPSSFAPGEGWEYSNTNYLLAGKVIEQATGRPWGEVVEARVLEPLGLHASFVEGSGTPTGPIVHGYSDQDGDYRDMFAINTGYGLPDGGLVATAEDLSTYVRAVATRAAPLTEASTLATSELVATGDDDRYGLGISHWAQLQGFEAWGHGGNLEGYSSEMFYFPARDVTLVLLVNGSDGDLDAIFDAVLERAIALGLE